MLRIKWLNEHKAFVLYRGKVFYLRQEDKTWDWLLDGKNIRQQRFNVGGYPSALQWVVCRS